MACSDYKEITRESYNRTSDAYTERVADLHPTEFAREFYHLMFPHAHILDLGCGSGRDAAIFVKDGYNVTGIDFSENMIIRAKENAPKGNFILMDIENIQFQNETFDGVWSSASLLHVPKGKILDVLKSVWKVLKPYGGFGIRLKDGEGERLEKDRRYGNLEKFNSYYHLDELCSLLTAAGFRILSSTGEGFRTPYDTHIFISVLCVKLPASVLAIEHRGRY